MAITPITALRAILENPAVITPAIMVIFASLVAYSKIQFSVSGWLFPMIWK
jgi:hypothetical protein